MLIGHRKEELTLETSAFESLYGGQFTFINPVLLVKLKIILLYSPQTQHHSFFRNLPLYTLHFVCKMSGLFMAWM